MVRKIISYRHYFINFYNRQDEKVQQKIEYVLDMIRFERQVSKKFYKHLENTNGIYEVRIRTTFKNIRLLCFHDNENLVVLVNCFVKKSQKTPGKEIKLAERLKKEYFKEKAK